MALLILLVSLIILLAIRVPVAFSLLISSMITFAMLGLNPLVAVQRLSAGVDVFTLMAIPFFIFAGDLMTQTGIAARLIKVILGLIIPPSHNMIIYAAASGVSISIGDLFIAGILPGILCGLALMIVVSIIARKKGYPKGIFPGP